MAKNFYQKMPFIYLITPKTIRNTISRQVSDRAQLPDVLKNADKESNRAHPWGPTSTGWTHPTLWPVHWLIYLQSTAMYHD